MKRSKIERYGAGMTDTAYSRREMKAMAKQTRNYKRRRAGER